MRDAAQLLWIVNLGCIDLNPHPVRADDLEHPDELRVDLDPGPGVAWDDVRSVALVVRDVLDEHGLRGWPKTSGSRGIHVNVRIERRWSFDQVRRAALALAREVERRAPDAGHQQVVEGGAPRRLPRLQPERQGPHRGLGLVGAADARRARLDAARLGRGRRLRSGGVHAGDRAGALRRARRRRGRHRRRRGLARRRCSSCRPRRRPRAWATRPGRRTTGSRAASRRAWRRRGARRAAKSAERRKAASAGGDRPARSSTQPLITVAKAAHKEDALAGLERWKARHPAAAALLAVDDVLVDAMRGRSTTWTRIRLNLRHVPEERTRPAEEAARSATTTPWARRASSGRRARSAARAEDALQLVGRRHLELIVAAVLGRLVGAPAHELRGVAEAVALHVVVGDLADALGAQRLPAQVLAAVPAAAWRRAGAAPWRWPPTAPPPSRARGGPRARSRAAAPARRRAAGAPRW